MLTSVPKTIPLDGALATIRESIASADRDRLAGILASLTVVAGEAAVRLITLPSEASNDSADEALDVDAAASRLGVSRDWVYRHAKKLPFALRLGRSLRFSSRGLDRYIANRASRNR